MKINIDATSVNMANELKAGKIEGFKNDIEYIRCAASPADYRSVLSKIMEQNSKDRKANEYLPGLLITEDEAGTRVFVSVPGQLTGNLWRNYQKVSDTSLHNCPSR